MANKTLDESTPGYAEWRAKKEIEHAESIQTEKDLLRENGKKLDKIIELLDKIYMAIPE